MKAVIKDNYVDLVLLLLGSGGLYLQTAETFYAV